MQTILNAVMTTISNIRSNRQVFVMSVVTIAIAFSILGLFLVIFVNLNAFLSTWSKQVQLIVYLEDGISKEQKKSLERLIEQNEDVESMNYVSREQAWEKFKTTFSGKSGFLGDLDFNPLPASYSIKFIEKSNRLERIKAFVDILKTQAGVESLEYGEKWIDRFEKFMIFLRVFILAAGGLLSLGLILIISNTIKLSIYSRKDEIELMLLIGATHRFVKFPLLLEGIFQGLAGSVVALGIVKFVHLYMKSQFQGSLESLLRGADLLFITPSLILAVVFSSTFIGWLGSFISINQFLYSVGEK